MGHKKDEALKTLTEKTASLEKKIMTVTDEHQAAVQDITRNTGRLNKVELDIKRLEVSIGSIETEQNKVKENSGTSVESVEKLAG